MFGVVGIIMQASPLGALGAGRARRVLDGESVPASETIAAQESLYQ